MFLSSGSAPVCIIDHLFPKVEQYFLNNSISNKLRFISFGDDNLKHHPKDGIHLYYTFLRLPSIPIVLTFTLNLQPPHQVDFLQQLLNPSIIYIYNFLVFHLSSVPSLLCTAILHFSQIILNAPIESLVNSLRVCLVNVKLNTTENFIFMEA